MEGPAAAEAENGGAGKGSGSRFRRVCVFCGSSSGKRSSYRDAAVELGKELVSEHRHAYLCSVWFVDPTIVVGGVVPDTGWLVVDGRWTRRCRGRWIWCTAEAAWGSWGRSPRPCTGAAAMSLGQSPPLVRLRPAGRSPPLDHQISLSVSRSYFIHTAS